MTTPRQPVLALNYLDGDEPAPPNFFQFGLAPEDEARQVAERAIADGRSRAIALVPEGDWGTRTLAAFRERFHSLGGTVLDAQTIGSRTQDHATTVARLLKIGSPPPGSKERVLFEPRPGNDPDFVFLAMQPAQARVVRPHFRFYGAGHLPIYATSHVFEGVTAPARDNDLEGVVFCDMPWTIGTGEFAAHRDRMRSQWPESYNRYPRLYALGYDAVRMLPVLAGREDASRIASATGALKLGSDGRVRRNLLWARFENGTPRLLGP
jgi:outer membrane PBP1 activator LpoA protein